MRQASSSALVERGRIRELSKQLARKQGMEYVWGRVVQLFALEPGFKVPLGLKSVDK